jgi:hypothetical protein
MNGCRSLAGKLLIDNGTRKRVKKVAFTAHFQAQPTTVINEWAQRVTLAAQVLNGYFPVITKAAHGCLR